MKFKIMISVLLLAFLGTAAIDCPAQKKIKDGLPRIGAIGDFEATSRNALEGCGNHALIPATKPIKYSEIFFSSPDGLLAWMNLNGQDLRLQVEKTTLWHPETPQAFARYEYRAGNVSITVSFPWNTDYISNYVAKIVLRKGRFTRTIKAVGLAQCD